MVISNTKQVIKNEFSDNGISLYCHFLYKFFGRPLLQVKRFRKFFDKNIYNAKYESFLKKANLKIIPEEYFISIFLTVMGGMFFFTVLTIVYLKINPLYAMGMFYGGILAIMGVGLFFYNYPLILAKARGAEIDAAIVYLLPYLKILSQEISLSKMIEIIDDFLIYKEIKIEFNRITYYKDFLGYDIHSSIRQAMESCPSRELSDLLNDMVTISNSGGNIYSYFDRKLENLNKEIESIEKKNIETLLIYSQIYVVLLLIAPLFYTVMSSILSLVNFSASGSASAAGSSDSYSSIILLLFFLPLAYIGFMMLIYYSKPLYSRLEPMVKD
jgi:archaellum biogenesis protein FlaJ (TadC family)